MNPAKLDFIRALKWEQLIQTYTRCRTTYPEDKLRAMSDIAQCFDPGCKYLAGMWECDFPRNLMWRLAAGGERTSTYVAPSWSWASTIGVVEDAWTPGSRPEGGNPLDYRPWALESIDYHGGDTELLDPRTPFGTVRSGHIILRGHIQPTMRNETNSGGTESHCCRDDEDNELSFINGKTQDQNWHLDTLL